MLIRIELSDDTDDDLINMGILRYELPIKLIFVCDKTLFYVIPNNDENKEQAQKFLFSYQNQVKIFSVHDDV